MVLRHRPMGLTKGERVMAISARAGVCLGICVFIGVASLTRPCDAETAKPAATAGASAKPADASAKPSGAGAKPTDASSTRKPGPPPDKQTSAKVNSYIDFMNAETNDVYAQREELFRYIDPKVGPTCKESTTLRQPIGPDYGKFDDYRKRINAKPALKPDPAALKMVDAVEGLWKLGKEPGPHSLLQAKTPDEWCKRLKEVFPRYVALFDQYAAGNRELSAFVDTFTEDRDLREVDAALKKYGKHYRYQFARLTLEGKIMMRVVREQLRSETPDVAGLREHFAAYFAIADETLAMMKKEPKEEAYPVNFKFFLIDSMPKLKSASDDLLTLLSGPKSKDFDKRLDSKWDRLVDAYNEIIHYGNTMGWDAKQK
jgi:hypothetical protein